jgi:CDP-diacylglycerol---serine O-phosphatidyltransferase
MWVRNMIPNMLTLGNLACGMVAIVVLMEGSFKVQAFNMIGLLMVGAMVCDFLDGFVARALKATSAIGKELDSLCDVVSFGVVPGLMVYQMLAIQMRSDVWINISSHSPRHIAPDPTSWQSIFPYIGLIIPLFSAVRLAKFNVDTRQSYGFLGLPTPANAFFFLSIFLIFGIDGMHANIPSWVMEPGNMGAAVYPALQWLHHPFVLAGLSILFSILLVTEIPLLALKFKDYTLKNNWPRYVLMVLSVILLAVLWFRAVPLIIVLYFVLSFIDRFISQKT